jgi:hypothetical protein
MTVLADISTAASADHRDTLSLRLQPKRGCLTSTATLNGCSNPIEDPRLSDTLGTIRDHSERDDAGVPEKTTGAG